MYYYEKRPLNLAREWPEDVLSDQEELDIASAIQKGLKIKCSPSLILEHLKKRPFYKTGGFFNLKSLELLHRKRYQIAAAKTEPTKPEPSKLNQPAVSQNNLENPVCKGEKLRNGDLLKMERASFNVPMKDCGAKVRAGALGNITNKPVKVENAHRVKASIAPPEPMVHPASTIHDDHTNSSGKSATRQKIRMMR